MKLRKILTILLIASAFAVGGAVQANAAVQADDPGDISYFSVMMYGEDETPTQYVVVQSQTLEGNIAANVPININENQKLVVNGNLYIQAAMNIGEGELIVNGNLYIDNTLTIEGGNVTVTGDCFQRKALGNDSGTFNVQGNFNQTKDMNLSDMQLNVSGNYYHTGGGLTIGNGKLSVTGDYTSNTITKDEDGNDVDTASNTCIIMSNADGYFLVGGKMTVNSKYHDASYYNYLAAGTLELKGDFLQMKGNSSNFVCRGEHKVIFTGSKQQNIIFESPTSSGFNIVGESSNSDVNITGSFSKLDADVTIKNFDQYKALNLGDRTLKVTGDFNSKGTVSGSTGKLNITGNYIQQSGAMYVEAADIFVGGDYRIQTVTENGYGISNGIILMTNESGHLTVGGKFVTQSNYNDASYYNYLAAGTLELKGDFLQMSSNSSNFNCGGTHKVIFTGTGEQNIVFKSPNYSGFNILGASTNNNVNLTGAVRTLGANVTLKNFNQYRKLSLTSNTLNVTENVNSEGEIYGSTGKLNITGNYIQQSGGMYVEAADIFVGGDYRIQSLTNGIYDSSSGIIQMTNESGHLTVGGKFVTQSVNNDASYYNYLTAGTLELKGDFLQMSSNVSNFNCGGTHKVIFTGTGEQNIVFQSPYNSGFNILSETSSGAVVNLKGRISKIDADVKLNNFEQYQNMYLNGQRMDVTGDMTAHGNVHGNAGSLYVEKNYIQCEKGLYVEDAYINVKKDFRIQQVDNTDPDNISYTEADAVILMTDESGYLTVGGKFVTQSNYNDASYYNYLTAGTLELKGDFLQMSSNVSNFNCIGSHKVIFTGEGLQNIVFESPTSSGFNIIGASTNGNVNLTGAIRTLGANATLKNFNQYRELSFDTNTLNVTENVKANGKIYCSEGKLNVSGNYVQESGGLYVQKAKVNIS